MFKKIEDLKVVNGGCFGGGTPLFYIGPWGIGSRTTPRCACPPAPSPSVGGAVLGAMAGAMR